MGKQEEGESRDQDPFPLWRKKGLCCRLRLFRDLPALSHFRWGQAKITREVGGDYRGRHFTLPRFSCSLFKLLSPMICFKNTLKWQEISNINRKWGRMGNVKLRPCCIYRVIATSMRVKAEVWYSRNDRTFQVNKYSILHTALFLKMWKIFISHIRFHTRNGKLYSCVLKAYILLTNRWVRKMSFTRVNKIRSFKPTCNFLSIVWTENNTNSWKFFGNCQKLSNNFDDFWTFLENLWKVFGNWPKSA